MAPTPCRGSLMNLMQLFYSIGSFLSAISLNIVSQDKPSNWLHAALSHFAFCGVAPIAWLFLPESIRWLCMNGRETQAKKVMASGEGSRLNVFRGTNRRRLIISFLPWHWQVAIGVPIIFTYSSYFFDMAGLAKPFNGTVATKVVMIVMLFIAVPLVERLGRRTLLLWFAPICIGSLLVIGGNLRGGGPAVVLCTWSIGYNTSAGSLGYIYVAESSTARLRAKTTGVAIIFMQGMATVYVYIAPIMLNSPALGMSNTGKNSL
ncbi:hypothetical protein BDV12DRAFT_200598 [Aspergillus spectabilis]